MRAAFAAGAAVIVDGARLVEAYTACAVRPEAIETKAAIVVAGAAPTDDATADLLVAVVEGAIGLVAAAVALRFAGAAHGLATPVRLPAGVDAAGLSEAAAAVLRRARALQLAAHPTLIAESVAAMQPRLAFALVGALTAVVLQTDILGIATRAAIRAAGERAAAVARAGVSQGLARPCRAGTERIAMGEVGADAILRDLDRLRVVADRSLLAFLAFVFRR